MKLLPHLVPSPAILNCPALAPSSSYFWGQQDPYHLAPTLALNKFLNHSSPTPEVKNILIHLVPTPAVNKILTHPTPTPEANKILTHLAPTPVVNKIHLVPTPSILSSRSFCPIQIKLLPASAFHFCHLEPYRLLIFTDWLLSMIPLTTIPDD